MDETSRHIKAFDFFYNDGITRSYPQVARYFDVSTTSVKKWAKQFGWQQRAKDKVLEVAAKEAEHVAKIEEEKRLKAEQDSLSPKEAYRKDIENTLKIIKATILSAVDPKTKTLNIKAETPADINALTSAYEKLTKLDILLSEDDTPKVENALNVQITMPAKKKNGQPPMHFNSKLTQERQDRIIDDIRSNMTIARACARSMITPQTLWAWKRAGEAEYDRIMIEVDKAKRAAIREGSLIASDALAVEDFIINKINELKPNQYFLFLMRVKEAEADAEKRNLEAIELARDGGEYVSEVHLVKDRKGTVTGRKEIKKYMQPLWTPAAWLLERKHPDLYGKHVKYDGILDANITNDGDGKNAAQQKDEMQAKKRVAELALTLIKMASQNNIQHDTQNLITL